MVLWRGLGTAVRPGFCNQCNEEKVISWAQGFYVEARVLQ